MPILTTCQRHRTLFALGERCPACALEDRAKIAERNAIPHRKAHRGAKHARIKAAVIARDGACVWCGTTDDLTCDYVIPLARGGEMTLENAVAACGLCNSSRGAQCRQ